MDRNGKNKTQRLCKYGFNYVLSKLIMDNGSVIIEDLWRRKSSYSSEFIDCDRSSVTRSRIDKVDTDVKIASNTKINHMMVSFTDHYNTISLNKIP